MRALNADYANNLFVYGALGPEMLAQALARALRLRSANELRGKRGAHVDRGQRNSA
jgi:hypothetical protein